MTDEFSSKEVPITNRGSPWSCAEVIYVISIHDSAVTPPPAPPIHKYSHTVGSSNSPIATDEFSSTEVPIANRGSPWPCAKVIYVISIHDPAVIGWVRLTTFLFQLSPWVTSCDISNIIKNITLKTICERQKPMANNRYVGYLSDVSSGVHIRGKRGRVAQVPSPLL